VEKDSEDVGVVEPAGAALAARDVPHKAGRVDDGAVHDGTGHVAEEADGELDEAERHGFVAGVDAAQNQQHRTHLGGRVHEHEQRKQHDVPHEVGALQRTVADDRLREGRVPAAVLQTRTLRKLEETEKTNLYCCPKLWWTTICNREIRI